MIVVVDDDVCFAEEVQDLLSTNGHPAVVVTHPHESSLALLDCASLLVLDLSLAATNALEVLEALRQRGHSPAVIILSGSGRNTLDSVHMAALRRGFPVLGALPKPVDPDDLLAHIALGLHGTQLAPHRRRPSSGNAVTHLRQCASLEYAGASLGLLDLDPDDPAAVVHSAMLTRENLADDGLRGFVIVQLSDAVVCDGRARAALCDGFGYQRVRLSNLVLDLGPLVAGNATAYARHLGELRQAGYGILLRASRLRAPPDLAELSNLPITMLAIDSEITRLALNIPDLGRALSDVTTTLFQHGIAPVCTDLPAAETPARLAELGFSLFGRETLTA